MRTEWTSQFAQQPPDGQKHQNLPAIALWSFWEEFTHSGQHRAVLHLEALEKNSEPRLSMNIYTNISASVPKVETDDDPAARNDARIGS
jgi:hypothetical protein